MKTHKRIVNGIDERKEITYPRPSIYYKRTKCNDRDEEECIEVVGINMDETKKVFKEIKSYLKKNDNRN